MGLDQYAYAAVDEKQYGEFWDGVEFDEQTAEAANPRVQKPREIACWRKHPNLQGWMEQRWIDKGGDPDISFNGVQLELTWEDLEDLERDVNASALPETQGFFFGQNADAYYLNEDLEFIKNARAEIFLGLRVFYNSSWW